MKAAVVPRRFLQPSDVLNVAPLGCEALVWSDDSCTDHFQATGHASVDRDCGF